MMLLLDFAVGSVNRSGRKKNHGDHSNNNTDREYLSVSNNSQKELDQNQESSPLLRWSLTISWKFCGVILSDRERKSLLLANAATYYYYYYW